MGDVSQGPLTSPHQGPELLQAKLPANRPRLHTLRCLLTILTQASCWSGGQGMGRPSSMRNPWLVLSPRALSSLSIATTLESGKN